MSKTIIVNIVGEQTIQNVVFIKSYPLADRYVFITTSKMEAQGKTNAIATASDIKLHETDVIEVLEDSLPNIDHALSTKLNWDDDEEILVHITGGTKIMSLGVYNYFIRLGSAKIFYSPIGKDEIIQIFPWKKGFSRKITYSISLDQYLQAYHVIPVASNWARKNTLVKSIANTQKLMDSYLQDANTVFEMAEKIRIKYRGKQIRSNQDGEKEYFDLIQAKFKDYDNWFSAQDKITKEEIKYITGDWFEEYIYHKVQEALDLPDDQIGIGIQLMKGATSNEYDVMFMYQNKLHVIECKTSVADNTDGYISQLFTNTLYKAATLKKEFGLNVNYYLFALNDFSLLSEDQQKRADRLNIKLLGVERLRYPDALSNYFNKSNHVA